ncbi:NmrA family protein [Ktedonobacter sp. SOSP1-85]|nr:NmrA family protein [Ktedonobacter sp. SOSP1-85]
MSFSHIDALICLVDTKDMKNLPTILILGATGKTGSRVARILEENGVTVRRASRSSKDVSFDWDDTTTWNTALQGVDRVYLVGPLLKTDILQQVSGFLDVAEANSISHVTYVSLHDYRAMPEETGPRRVEIEFGTRSGFTHTVLRPAWFMQNFSQTFLRPSGGQIIVPAGSGSEAFIDVEDIAAVAAETLLHPDKHNGETYMLTGPESLTMSQAAKSISSASGQDIKYVDVNREDWVKGVVASGIPAAYGEVLKKLTQTIADKNGSKPTQDVQKVIGRNPISFADFALREVAAWSQTG